MTLASPAETAGPPGATSKQLIPPRVKVVLAASALALFGFIGYGIGTSHGTESHVLTGRAYVGASQASVKVGGWYYGFEISPNGMTWYDAGGGSHEGGVPPCLQHSGYAWIRFGYANAAGLEGESWRAVTWVQCINRH